MLSTHLQDTELLRLDEPTLEELHEQIRQQKPNILFYAGHSSSDANGTTGSIELNQQEKIAISYLKSALRKAVQHGLQLVIFNSCQGLGIARELADLHIPQIIVMREIVPDNVAQKFLQYFLEAYICDGMTFNNSVREARENLSWLEYKCPGATWLPVIFQNPAEVPLTWQELCNASTTNSQEISMFKVIEQLKQWFSNSQKQTSKELENEPPSKELTETNVSNQTKSVLQNQLDSLECGAAVSLSSLNGEYTGEYAGPIILNRPLILDGGGATIWSLAGPVLSIESSGVSLRNLRIEVTGCEDGTSFQDKCAILVKSGQGLQFDNIEVRGRVMGLPEEEGEWEYPSSIHLGKLAPEVEYNLRLRIIVPVKCRIVCDISGLQFKPHELSPGANEICLNIEKFPRNQDILIDGNIFLVSAFLKRRIAITAYIKSTQDEESSLSQNSIVWQPKDCLSVVNALNSKSEEIEIEPSGVDSTPKPDNNTQEPQKLLHQENNVFIKQVRPNPETFNSQPINSSENNDNTKLNDQPKNKLGDAFTTETEDDIS